jgi:hypothetical protein
MQPEERFTKIENFLEAVAEHQAHHSEQSARNAAQIARNSGQLAEVIEIQKSMAVGMVELRESQETSHRQFVEEMTTIRETLRITGETLHAVEEKLHALIDTVDRIIRNRNN